MTTGNGKVLPDFTRWSWASVEERLWWQPLFQEAVQTFQDLELLSVAKELRAGCWLSVPATELVARTQWAQENGLICVPTSHAGSSSTYQSTILPVAPGKVPDVYRCFFTTPKYYGQLHPLTDEHAGVLLGYPACCRDAFARTWGQGQVDSTWEQWAHTKHVSLAHTLLRWMGIRLVSHMPCTFDCAESQQIVERNITFGIENGHRESMQLLMEVLQWPVKWSRLFGIAEITTPAVKISTRTDWTPTKQMFATPGVYHKPDKTLWEDNKFSTPSSMREAHRPLLSVLADVPQRARVLDLGCGNGWLLRQLKQQRPDVRIAGVEQDAAIVARIPDLSGQWWASTITNAPWAAWAPTVVVISVARFLDAGPEAAQALLDGAPNARWIVYSYSDVHATDALPALITRAFARPLSLTALTTLPAVSIALITGTARSAQTVTA